MTLSNLLKQPSGFLPVVLSSAALVLVLAHVVMFGATREADEGATAHLWQLLMVVQVPILAFFLIRWLPQAPRPALLVLALQATTALAAIAPVYFLHL